MGLKSQPKLNRHSDKCLVKISDQNTLGVRCSKSQTESEQNWFSENKTSWLFFPVYFICDSFMDVDGDKKERILLMEEETIHPNI